MQLFKRNKYKNYSDETLIEVYQKTASKQVIGELYERYGHLVFGFAMKYTCNKLESEDITMNLFEQLGEKIKKKPIKYFKNWLYAVTKNECLMQLRRNKKLKLNNEINLEYYKDEIEDVYIKEIQIDAIEMAISKLKEEQKVCIEMFYLEKKSYHQISEITGFDMLQVKSAIQNGKRNLKINLLKDEAFKEYH